MARLDARNRKPGLGTLGVFLARRLRGVASAVDLRDRSHETWWPISFGPVFVSWICSLKVYVLVAFLVPRMFKFAGPRRPISGRTPF